jgi:hypothetical protein
MELEKKEFSQEKRQELADKGHALPDGSFPIENVKDLHNAIQSIGRAKNPAEAKAHIIRRAKTLKAESALPEDWKVKKFFEDVKNLIKAIGTSSSANEERDERSVENYVRQNYNTNTQTGGNTIVSNTTEPDPKGDIAVTKSFPTAGGDHLISQGTRPTDGATSVSDAPNSESVVPNQETIPSSATSTVAPSRQNEMNNPTEEGIEKAATCKECGQALPVAKAEEITKAAACPDCGKSMDLCDCMGKAVDSESKETPADEARETRDEQAAEAKAGTEKPMNKSLWGGAFAPVK